MPFGLASGIKRTQLIIKQLVPTDKSARALYKLKLLLVESAFLPKADEPDSAFQRNCATGKPWI